MWERCYDCRKKFRESRGLSTHLRFCPVARRKRKEEDEGLLRARKKARHSGASSDPDLGGINEDNSAVTDIAPVIEVPPAPESPPASFSFSGRRRKVPRALKDYIPHSLVGLPSHLCTALPRPTPPTEPEVPSTAPIPDPEPEPEADNEFRTEPNGFGLYRQYTRKPRIDPEDSLTLADLVDDDAMPEQQQSEAAGIETPLSTTVDFFHPFPNVTVFRYVNWYLGTSGALSAADLDRLAREVISSDDFNPEDLRNFSTAREMARLDKHGSTDVPFAAKDGWKQGSVTLHLPKAGHKYASESASPQFCVTGIPYRPLLEVIKRACQSPQSSKKYHWVPFKLVHQTQAPSAHLRVYTDIYNSDAMLEEDAKIRALGRHPDDDPNTEVAILAMLFWSDSTHLTSFGTASLWPIYLYFGNLSKYARGRPNARAAHHIAYIPSVSLKPALCIQADLLPCPPQLPDTIQDSYVKTYNKPATAEVLRFLKVELMQQIWLLILDDAFVDAYKHGILITCGDGVRRRIFPRIFTYAADYPEK